jgi:hypothetical protein
VRDSDGKNQGRREDERNLYRQKKKQMEEDVETESERADGVDHGQRNFKDTNPLMSSFLSIFWGPNGTRFARCHFRAKKVSIFRGPPS